MTKEQAAINIATSPFLGEVCCDLHKAFYGLKNREMTKWSNGDLIRWWNSHYSFNEETQKWDNIKPFY